MTTPIPPTLSGATPPLQGMSAGTGAGGATGVPPGILALPHGTLVRGQIVQIEPHSGLATLRTPKGDITLKTDFMLTRGSEVVIRLDTSAHGLTATIISVDGLSARELEANPANLQRATAPVDDLLDLPVNNTSARQASVPVTRLHSSGTAPLAEGIADAVIIDIPDSSVPLPTTPLRAVLLSRAPELPQLLAMLPPSVVIPKERLEAGATLRVVIQSPVTSHQSSVVSEIPSILAPSPSLTSPLQGTKHEAQSTPASTLTTHHSPLTTPAPNPSPTAPLQATKHEAQGTSALNPSLPATSIMKPTPAMQMLEQVVTTGIGQSTVASQQSPVASEEIPSLTAQALSPSQGIGQQASGIGAVVSSQSSVVSEEAPSLAPNHLTTSPSQGTSPPAPSPSPTSPIQSTTPLTTHHSTLPQGILTAQVIGTEQSGETVLRTPLGVIKLDLVSHTGQKIQLPHEAQIQLQLLSLEATPNDTAIPLKERLTIPATIAELSQQWEGLEEAMTVLQQSHPAMAQQVMQQHIPQAGPKLARDILFFLLALKTDDAEQWIGKKTLEALEQSSRADIVRKFSSELGTIRQLFTNPPSPDWQAAFIPIHHQGEWQQIRLYVKRDREKEEGQQHSKDNASTRFIMEVDLSRMGSLQFDGFVKKHSQNTQFDLVIRSAQALRAEDQHAIRSIYADAAAITGFKGSIGFQTGHPFPIQPLEEMLKSDKSYIA